MATLFKELKESLEQAIEIERGEVSTYTVNDMPAVTLRTLPDLKEWSEARKRCKERTFSI